MSRRHKSTALLLEQCINLCCRTIKSHLWCCQVAEGLVKRIGQQSINLAVIGADRTWLSGLQLLAECLEVRGELWIVSNTLYHRHRACVAIRNLCLLRGHELHKFAACI